MEPPFLLQALKTAQKSPLTLPTQKSQAFLSSAESCRLQQPRKKKGHFSPRVSHTSGFVDTQNFFFVDTVDTVDTGKLQATADSLWKSC